MVTIGELQKEQLKEGAITPTLLIEQQKVHAWSSKGANLMQRTYSRSV